ncbi:MAG: PEP/pyruvate-binding domain-containing protein [Candidatus Fermentibacter sp.]|nr:PEP/pyruvate-binding domain-containing protein [Candidatus Fermentibacter sp.]
MRDPIPDSDALRANIADTARKVAIPDRFSPLVSAVEKFHGVRGTMVDTLTEYFHEFRNIDTLVEGFQTILLRDWAYVEQVPDRAVLFRLLAELLSGLIRSPLEERQTSALLRIALLWTSTAVAGRHGEEYSKLVPDLCADLSSLLSKSPGAFLERDSLLRELYRRGHEFPGLAEPLENLYRSVLGLGYRYARDHLDVASWSRSEDTGLAEPDLIVSSFSFLSAGELSALESALSEAQPRDLLSGALPSFSDLVDRAVAGIFEIDDPGDRFLVCLYYLKDDSLGYRQQEVLNTLLLVVKDLMEPDRHADVHRILSRLKGFFGRREDSFLIRRFQCYEAIGTAIGRAGNTKAADHIIEDILYWKFQYPEVGEATDEWETVVNPYHLPKIRCWMRIIESNPALYEQLAAALNVQLRLGGVFISDTDLFQRDITRFLNADIGPVYFVAKQLLRTFPSYFSDLGAEGELRSVSTRIDEICGRRDSLIHFLRKQTHAESSSRLVDFSRSVLRYWATSDASPLRRYLSGSVFEAVLREHEHAKGPGGVLARLHEHWGGPCGDLDSGDPVGELIEGLATLSPQSLAERMEEAGHLPEADRTRVALMIRLYQLLRSKYSFSTDSLEKTVLDHTGLDTEARRAFSDSLRAWRQDPRGEQRDALMDAMLDVMEQLKEIVLDPAPSAAVENIYHKRHIAAGIPSMYGSYSEPKFEALGLTFRLETLLARLLDDLVSQPEIPFVNRASLRKMAKDLRRFDRVLALDGVNTRTFTASIGLLEASFSWHNITFHQYRNIFLFLVQSVSSLSRASILSHDQILRIVLSNDPRQCEARGMTVDAVSEIVLREVLVSAQGIQALDRYVGDKYRQISDLAGSLSPDALTRMMNYDPDCLISPLHESRPAVDDQMTLGYKGLGLKHLAAYGLNVPECFVITAELFSALPAMSYGPMYRDTIGRIRRALDDMEEKTGLRLGDRDRPLILSIRSGSAISMPGFMTTFVDVGLNPDLTEALSQREGYAWAAWDSYRRFVQTWAMSFGHDREVFDEIMIDFKKRYGVQLKMDFAPEHMREMAAAYRTRAEGLGVAFVDDPFEQVVACIHKVLESWDSPHARFYRSCTGIADDWGTAVILQRMVFGNRNRLSGSGVTFTRNPHDRYTRQVRLFGDFTTCSQGEDLVGGLVSPMPISEAQRLGSSLYDGVENSLEKDFPDVYRTLLEASRDIVSLREYDPQEIEFTFESPSGGDLYFLQKRPMVSEPASDAPYFVSDAGSPAEPVALGMGVSGGAYSGRVAVNREQIEMLLAGSPGESILLLRPDTVPEDIEMIVKVQGILTARGGATSHAAVTAKRLGKTAVVDCHRLEVDEQKGSARLAGLEMKPGDWLSIDGRTGHIFPGRLPVTARPI